MRRALVGLLSAVLLTQPAHAQSLRDHFSRLFTFGNCGQPLCLDVDTAVNRHGSHFIPQVVQGERNMLAFITDAISLSISNIPFTAAASGLAFSFEEGVPVATAVSPGPIFAERAETMGKGRFLIGANISGIGFDNIRGVPLDRLQLNFTHVNVGENTPLGDPEFERDVLHVTTSLELSLIVSNVFASFGVSDRIDVGVAVPIVHASLSGSSTAEVVQHVFPTPHTFDDAGTTRATSSTSASATGIGDIAARLKINLYQTPSLAAALLGDVRLPTGREEDFLGSGATTVRVMGIVSGRRGNFSPHANVGFLYTNAQSQNNRVLATVGFDQLLSDIATLAVDLVSSFETADSKLTLPEPVVFTAGGPVQEVQLTDIPHQKDNFIDASFGMKFSPGGVNRVVTNVLFPLVESGVRPSLMWTLGFERTF